MARIHANRISIIIQLFPVNKREKCLLFLLWPFVEGKGCLTQIIFVTASVAQIPAFVERRMQRTPNLLFAQIRELPAYARHPQCIGRIAVPKIFLVLYLNQFIRILANISHYFSFALEAMTTTPKAAVVLVLA